MMVRDVLPASGDPRRSYHEPQRTLESQGEWEKTVSFCPCHFPCDKRKVNYANSNRILFILSETLPQPDPNNPGGRMGGGSGPRTGNTSPGRGALEVSSTPEDSREAWRFSGRGSCPRRVRHPVGEHLCGKGPSVNRRWGFAPICDRVSPLSSVHEASVCSRAARFSSYTTDYPRRGSASDRHHDFTRGGGDALRMTRSGPGMSKAVGAVRRDRASAHVLLTPGMWTN